MKGEKPMSRAAYNPAKVRIKTDAGNLTIPIFGTGYHIIPADKATAESNTAVMALTALGAEATEITTGLTNPTVPRNVKAICSASGVTTKVTVNGTNFAGDAISEEITLNGQTAVAGSLAFASVTSVELPVQTHTPAHQVATVAVTAGASGAGDEVFTFTSAATGTAYDITATFAATDDTTAEAAVVIRAALNADETFAEHWTAGGSSANVTITAKEYAAQDSTINLVVKTAGTPACTLGSITANTTAGVAEDKVSVGVGKSFGIPYKLTADELVIVKLFNNAADSGTVTADDNEIEKNVIALNGVPDGLKAIELFYIVKPR
jgi:hypothetical protein